MKQITVLNDEYPLIYGGYEVIDHNGNYKGLVENSGRSGFITNFLLKRNSISIGCVLIKADLLKEIQI